MWPYLEHGGPIPFAHRGGAGDWPENTMPAFADAVALGYRYLETDVHLSRDGVVVAFHDESLERVSDGTGNISEHRWSELAQVRVGGSEPIPRLEEILRSFPDARINIDTKSDAVVEPLIDLLRRTGSLDRVCVGSFSEGRLRRVREALGADVCTSLGPRSILRLVLRSFRVPVDAHVAPCLQVPVRWNGMRIITDRFLDHAHAHGMQVHAWTIDDPDEMRQLLDQGVDGIMTDRPAVLKQVLHERGQWIDT
ncbi:MAG: glycerophosphodiester phosphodiesterase [Acidimicrobiia bacterium]|nr:glycerophosphodiester phosphodiesterase [Acidimicrobiia bacterium]MDH5236037.1 glycerophosphodiester phosphodiesterase [Acidimicrobiia bacterium]